MEGPDASILIMAENLGVCRGHDKWSANGYGVIDYEILQQSTKLGIVQFEVRMSTAVSHHDIASKVLTREWQSRASHDALLTPNGLLQNTVVFCDTCKLTQNSS